MIANRLRRKTLYCQADYWDSKAKEYDPQAASWWPNTCLSELHRDEMRAMIDRCLGDVAGLRVLDLGCGTGTISRYLSGRGAVVDGVDFSSEAIDVAKRMSHGDEGAPNFEVGSIQTLDAHQAYDVVITVGVLTIACQDAGELAGALDKIASATRPGGQILLLEAVHSGPLHRVLKLGRRRFMACVREQGWSVTASAAMFCWPARIAVGYVRLPGWVTRPVYRLGDAVMRLTGSLWLGDYLAVHARTQSN